MQPTVESVQAELLESYQSNLETLKHNIAPLLAVFHYQREHITRLETENRDLIFEIEALKPQVNPTHS